jgi:hypothetical protein
VVLDFRREKNGEAITLEEMKAHAKRMHARDLMFFWTGMDVFYHDN